MSSTSSEYPGYGTFTVTAAIDLADVEEVVAAMKASIEKLATGPVDDDLMERARRPILERFANRLKSLGSWMTVADRAQSEPERLERFDAWPAAIEAIDGDQLSRAAKKWLYDQQPVEILVVPAGSALAQTSVAGEQAQ